MHVHGFINLTFIGASKFWLVRTYIFSKNPTQGFINETPAVVKIQYIISDAACMVLFLHNQSSQNLPLP